MTFFRILSAIAALSVACTPLRGARSHAGSHPVAAGAGGTVGADALAKFFPLAVGNAWTFLDRSPQQAEPVRRSVHIVGRDPQGYFLDDQRGALRVDSDCLHDRVRQLLCHPLALGATWLSVVSETATERYLIAAIDETVTVPAGTFHGCVRVRARMRAGATEHIAELTYAPGVGPVKLETFAVVNGTAQPQVSGVLESYQIADGRK